MKVNLNLASIEAEEHNFISFESEKGGLILMMTIMVIMMIMRIKTICEVINKSRIKVKVIMIMSIELVIAQSKRQLSTVVIKTSFIELENKELPTYVVVYQ